MPLFTVGTDRIETVPVTDIELIDTSSRVDSFCYIMALTFDACIN